MLRNYFYGLLLLAIPALAQSTKPKSYIISKEEFYTIDVKDNKPSIVALATEKKWVGDKDNNYVRGNRIDYASSFEDITEIEAFSISPSKKKEKVRNFFTEDVEIENIFHHDMKYKYYYFSNLEEGSETFTSFRKNYRYPQFLDAFYFRDGLDVKDSKLALKVSKDVEIGYVLRGLETDKIKFTSVPEGDYTTYTWQMLDGEKEEMIEDAPARNYYSPHVIFYIKNYKTASGKRDVVGSIDNLYKFYYNTVKDINTTDQSAVKTQTLELINGLSSDYDKAKAIFDYVQSKVNYVAFEDGMGGFVPREAADVYQKKYGDCKDMANLLNEMMKYAGIECYTAWIGTRHNNYTYEQVPTPIVDNHMIAVAKINGEYIFLDATGQYTLFPGFTSFIQGKQALLKIDESNYKIVPVPVVAASANNMTGKISVRFEGNTLSGAADFRISGFLKSQFNGYYKSAIDKNVMLKEYLSRFISHINTSAVIVSNDDLTLNPVGISHNFTLDKWTKETDGQLILKPALFSPYADMRIDVEKRKVPIELPFNKSYDFEYEFEIPAGYKVEYRPEDFTLKNDLIQARISYTLNGNKIIVKQSVASHVLLIEKEQFAPWNTAIKTITKQYNQNIILSKI